MLDRTTCVAHPRRLCDPIGARLQVEELEDRLALSWTGVPPSAIAPPPAAAVVLSTQGSGQGTATISGTEVDYYTFIAPVSGPYTLSALTPSSNLDPVLGVFTAAGARIAYNDDISSSNRDSRLTVILTAGSRYYFGITNYTGTAGGAYTFQVAGPTAAPADDSYEDNDSFAAASDLGTLTAVRTVSGLVMADAADWFRFTTAATGAANNSVAIAFQNAQGNLGLELYNAAGQLLRQSNGTGNTESVTLSSLAAGTYSVRIVGTAGATNPGYTLTVSPPAAVNPPPPAGSFDIVVRVNGLTAAQQAVFDQAAARWEQIITGDVPSATYQGAVVDDILIDASAAAIDGVGRVLGQAGPDALRNGSFLPIHGIMQFDSADLANMQSNGTLYAVILHEMGHVLGVGTIWRQLGLLSGAGTTNPRFFGPQATAAYNSLFGASGTSVPVEGLPSAAGSRDSHWRESLFGAELMTPYISSSSNPISRVTVASLADLGYTVNLNAANTYVPPGLVVGGGGAAPSGGGASLVLGPTATASAFALDLRASAAVNLTASLASGRPVNATLENYGRSAVDEVPWRSRRQPLDWLSQLARPATADTPAPADVPTAPTSDWLDTDACAALEPANLQVL